MADVSSNENNTLGPVTNTERFRLGALLRPSSPTGTPHHSPTRPNVLSTQQHHTTAQEAVSENNGNAESSTHPSQNLHNPPSERADDNKLPHDDDEEDDSDDEVLHMPATLGAKFKSKRKEAEKRSKKSQEVTLWPRHVFRLVERDGHRYYDVRGDAVSYSGKD